MSAFDELRSVIEPAIAKWLREKIDREVCPLERELRAMKNERDVLLAELSGRLDASSELISPVSLLPPLL